MRVLHTMIRVGDLETSLAFYTGVLGMRLLRRQDYAEGRFTLAFVGYCEESEGAVLELTHEIEQVRPDDGRVVPLERVLERAAGDVLGHGVDEGPEVLVVAGEVAGPLVIDRAAEDDVGHRSKRLAHCLALLWSEAVELEAAVGRIELVFGHNDLLPANFLHDGARLWLIDWDYAGFNSPLFDLGGLAANNGLTNEDEGWMLASYFGRAPDAALWRAYRAMKAGAALRETMWSMVSELHSTLDFDFAAYTAANLETYRAALAAFEA